MAEEIVIKGEGYIATKIEDRYKLEFLTGGHFPYEEDIVIITKEELESIKNDPMTINKIVLNAKKREGIIGFECTIKGKGYVAIETDTGFRYKFPSKDCAGEEDYIDITRDEFVSIVKDPTSFTLIYYAAKKRMTY